MSLLTSADYHRPTAPPFDPTYTSLADHEYAGATKANRMRESKPADTNTTGDTPKALETQVGGAHYKDMKIQPLEFIHANNIGFCEANAIKYLCRWRTKNGIQDLEKAAHYIALLIQFETEKTDGNKT